MYSLLGLLEENGKVKPQVDQPQLENTSGSHSYNSPQLISTYFEILVFI